MSNRRRTVRASRSYTTRLAHRPRRLPRWRAPVLRWLDASGLSAGWLGAGWLAPVLAVAAEVGHLAAAYLEWPESVTRGIYHVLTGALLGLVAVSVSAGSGRVRLAGGAVVAGAGPLLWLAGTLSGIPVYAELPVPAAASIAVIEAALAAVLVLRWRAG